MKFREIIIQEEKLTNYLLSTTHLIGKTKARFFRGFGFHENNLKLFKDQLLKTVEHGTITEKVVSAYGTKFVIENLIETPSGKSAKIKTVWILEASGILRFVTAYPS